MACFWHTASLKQQYSLDGQPGAQAVQADLLCCREANQLVEEFMLLANISAATAVAAAFPDRALLRRHPQPNPRKLAAAASAAKEAGANPLMHM